MVALKRVASVNDDSLPENCDPNFEFRYVDISAVGDGRLVAEPETLVFSAAPSRARRLTRSGDILVSTVRTYLRAVCPVDERLSDVVASTGFAVVRARNIHPKYLSWVLRSSMFEEVVNRSTGVSYPAINPSDLISIQIPCPPANKQEAIADFLDAETARMDSILSPRNSQLLIMDERDRSLIDAAFQVIEATTRLGRFVTVQTGLTVDAARSESDDDVEAPYLRVANVQHGRLDLRTVTRVRVPRSLAERSTLRPGDVLMTEGGDIDKLGRGTVWDGAIPGCLHQNHVFAVRAAGGLNPKFLAHFTRTSSARAHFESTGVHSTNLASTSASKVKDLPFPVVSSAFQERMVDGLETCLARSASVARKIRESITLLTERKQALITAAVTGKLDMARNIAEEAS